MELDFTRLNSLAFIAPKKPSETQKGEGEYKTPIEAKKPVETLTEGLEGINKLLNQYHIVFCPKYRRKVLVGDIEKDLRQIFYDIAKEKDVEIKALEIMPDHVHMFISFDPRQHLHSLVRYFKGTSNSLKE